jgi:hypothetical protein
VSWARENAARNARANCEYLAADASAVFAAIPFAGVDAAVIVDPPRKGCGDAFLAQLAAFAPRTIVYVSCNPETQARDIAVLAAAGYACLRVQPFDMFPQTRHVEAVARRARPPSLTLLPPRPRGEGPDQPACSWGGGRGGDRGRRGRFCAGAAHPRPACSLPVGGVVAVLDDAADAHARLADF